MFNFPPGYVIFLCQSTNLTLINLIYYGPSPGLAACIHPQVSKKINHSLEKYKSDQGEGSKKSLIRQLCLPHTRGTPHLWPGQRHLYGQLCLFIPMTIQATPSSSTSHFSPPPSPLCLRACQPRKGSYIHRSKSIGVEPHSWSRSFAGQLTKLS